MKTCLKGAVIVPPYWGSLCSTFFFPEIAFYFWKAISGFFEKFLYPDFLVLFHFNRLTTRPQACETFTTLVLRLPAENDFQNSDRQNFPPENFFLDLDYENLPERRSDRPTLLRVPMLNIFFSRDSFLFLKSYLRIFRKILIPRLSRSFSFQSTHNQTSGLRDVHNTRTETSGWKWFSELR